MLRIERRNVEGLGSKEMAFDKVHDLACCVQVHVQVHS